MTEMMEVVMRIVLLALLLVSIPGIAFAQNGYGSPSFGRDYARSHCADCHAVERGDLNSPDALARPFQQIAETPGMTGMALYAWLMSPHPTMPDLIIEADDMRDVVAYILSLDQPKR
jgi:mono/diheme cytochrome c family protein